MAHESREVVVAENGAGRYQQQVTVAAHTLIADEPVSMGGNDAGPAPFDYLLTALGACTSMTLRMYAELKQLPLERVSVTLTHEKVEVEGKGKIDRISRRIGLEGNLTPEQRNRMLEIANRCPVHRTLSGNLEIDSSLAAA
jgi:putative redox protein